MKMKGMNSMSMCKTQRRALHMLLIDKKGPVLNERDALLHIKLKGTKLQSMVHHRIYPIFIFDLDLGVTQNIAQYPLHHVTLYIM